MRCDNGGAFSGDTGEKAIASTANVTRMRAAPRHRWNAKSSRRKRGIAPSSRRPARHGRLALAVLVGGEILRELDGNGRVARTTLSTCAMVRAPRQRRDVEQQLCRAGQESTCSGGAQRNRRGSLSV